MVPASFGVNIQVEIFVTPIPVTCITNVARMPKSWEAFFLGRETCLDGKGGFCLGNAKSLVFFPPSLGKTYPS